MTDNEHEEIEKQIEKIDEIIDRAVEILSEHTAAFSILLAGLKKQSNKLKEISKSKEREEPQSLADVVNNMEKEVKENDRN